MAGPVPAISRGTLPLQMAGTSPAMTVRSGFIQGRSADGRCELTTTGKPELSAFADCPGRGAKGRLEWQSRVRIRSNWLALPANGGRLGTPARNGEDRRVGLVVVRSAGQREDAMIELLEQQKKLTANQWKLICTANLADLLDFFDFFLIGYVTAALTKQWSLTYWEGGESCSPPVSARFLVPSSGAGSATGSAAVRCSYGRRSRSRSPPVSWFSHRDRTPVPGWLFLMFFRFFVGVGNAGIFTIDLPLVQEFIPAYKRGWVSALITTLLPAGSMLAGLAAWQLLPIVGWRGLFLVGLVPMVLVFMIRWWVPESPRWLMLHGRREEARQSLAWALMVDPNKIALPRLRARGRENALGRAVRVSAAGRHRVSHRPDPDRGRFARAVGTDVAGARPGAQDHPGIRGVPDDIRQPGGGSSGGSASPR